MRKIVRTGLAALAVLLFEGTGGFAIAADLAKPAAPEPAKVEMVPAFHGLYIGALLGHSAGQINDPEGFKIPRSGYTGGVLVGYNHRLPHLVVGLEGDFELTDISGETNAGGGFTVRGSSKLITSLRGRVGVPWGSTLFYLTGGPALTTAKLAVDDIGSSSDKNTKGWAFGGGVESYSFGNLGWRIEYIHNEWTGQSFTIDNANTGKLGSGDDRVRAGLVFRLN